MTLTLTASTVTLDEDQIGNLISDLADLSTDIDVMLAAEDRQQRLAELLDKLNALTDIYS